MRRSFVGDLSRTFARCLDTGAARYLPFVDCFVATFAWPGKNEHFLAPARIRQGQVRDRVAAAVYPGLAPASVVDKADTEQKRTLAVAEAYLKSWYSMEVGNAGTEFLSVRRLGDWKETRNLRKSRTVHRSMTVLCGGAKAQNGTFAESLSPHNTTEQRRVQHNIQHCCAGKERDFARCPSAPCPTPNPPTTSSTREQELDVRDDFSASFAISEFAGGCVGGGTIRKFLRAIFLSAALSWNTSISGSLGYRPGTFFLFGNLVDPRIAGGSARIQAAGERSRTLSFAEFALGENASLSSRKRSPTPPPECETGRAAATGIHHRHGSFL